MQDVNSTSSGLLVPASGLLRDQVYARLRDAIITGRYESGYRLRDTEVASELGISRTPVREALRRLEDEGFVETWANRWTRVAAVDLDAADHIYPIIASLERLVLLQAHLQDDQLPELQDANDQLKHAIANGDPVAASSADRRFHDTLLLSTTNQELTRIISDLKLRLRRIEVHYFDGSLPAQQSIIEHQAVIDALRRGNLDDAACAVEENWRHSLERLHQATPNPPRATTHQ